MGGRFYLMDIFEAMSGATSREEQHIMQKTIARKRYPVFEKLLEFDLDRTNLRDSRRSSLSWWRGA